LNILKGFVEAEASQVICRDDSMGAAIPPAGEGFARRAGTIGVIA